MLNSPKPWGKIQTCDNCKKETNDYHARVWIGAKETGRVKTGSHYENYAGATYRYEGYTISYNNTMPLLIVICDECYEKEKKLHPSVDEKILRNFINKKIVNDHLEINTIWTKPNYDSTFKDKSNFNEIVQTRPHTIEVLFQSAQNNFIRSRRLYFATIENFIWPNSCVICGSSDSIKHEEQSILSTDKEKISPPVCRKHWKNSIKTITSIFLISILVVFIALGVVSFFVGMSTLQHLGVCICGLPLAMLIVFSVVIFVSNKFIIGKFTLYSSPLERIQKEGNYYTMVFHNSGIAKKVFELNKERIFNNWEINNIINLTSY